MYYERTQSERPSFGTILSFDHVRLWVGNAKQAAHFYSTSFGFSPYAYSGLETGNREWATHVVKNGKIIIALSTPYNKNDEFSDHINKHGDGVRDVAFTVEDAEKIYKHAIEKGAKSVQPPTRTEDENGYVITASILTYGDTVHTFVQRNYSGAFLPGFKLLTEENPINEVLGVPAFGFIDHCVGNHALGDMEPTVQWYEKILDFHRFWSVDDSMIHTEYSALKSIVVADFDENVKMPMNEPAIGKKKSQIQEYVDYYNNSGVQHIALNIPDIISVVKNLRKRGLKFLKVPPTYYDNLRKRLEHSSLKINEDIDVLQELSILVDHDDKGYLLQIFTGCVQDRPTLFYEFIQRNNFNGFGAGNFKSLFEAIEREQEMRGNLDN